RRRLRRPRSRGVRTLTHRELEGQGLSPAFGLRRSAFGLSVLVPTPNAGGHTPLRPEAPAVGTDHLGVPLRGVLRDALLGEVVNVHQSEAQLVAFRPLEVVEQRPLEV